MARWKRDELTEQNRAARGLSGFCICLTYSSALYREAHIRRSHGGLAVGYQQHRAVLALGADGAQDDALVQAVKIGGRLVQQQKGGIVQKCPRHADALPLAAGKGAAQLAHRGVVALGQAADKVIQRSLFAGGFHLFLRSIALCDADVVADGIRKQFSLLRHKAFLCAQGGGVHPPDVLCAEPDAAGLHVPEAHQQPQQVLLRSVK